MLKKFKNKNIREPINGFRDLIGQEVRLRTYVSNKIGELFQKWGYDQIVFPFIEKASSFSKNVVGGSPWPEWNKKSIFYLYIQNYRNSYRGLSNQIPSLLIPEGTISVSRWLAKMLVSNKNEKELFPIKVFYIIPCFRNELTSKISATKRREFNQVGAEILGTSNLLADIEILFLIYEGFRAINIPKDSIIIRMGNVEIFNLLCAESKINKQARIDLKNSLDIIAESRAGKEPKRLKPEINRVMNTIKKMGLSEQLTKKWGFVCNTFTKNIDEKTETFLGYKKPIEELNKVASVFQKRGIKCFIDPSVIRSHEYYTGIVYEIDLKISNKIFVEVAGGGRYNKLISKFLAKKEYQIPAVGFAYGLERLVEFFKLTQKSSDDRYLINYWLNKKGVDKVLYSQSQKINEIINLFTSATNERNKNKRISIYVGNGNEKEAYKYSQKLGAEFSEK